jgi:hypothetical protein
MRSKLLMHLHPALRSPNAEQELVPGAGDAERPMSDARRTVPKGNKNAFKHGLHTGDAIARRRKVSRLMRAARALARKR